MSRLIRYLRGSVRFRLTGAAPEQCLNALAAARLEFWDIEREDALHLSLSVPAREAERLQDSCKKGDTCSAGKDSLGFREIGNRRIQRGGV